MHIILFDWFLRYKALYIYIIKAICHHRVHLFSFCILYYLALSIIMVFQLFLSNYLI